MFMFLRALPSVPSRIQWCWAFLCFLVTQTVAKACSIRGDIDLIETWQGLNASMRQQSYRKAECHKWMNDTFAFGLDRFWLVGGRPGKTPENNYGIKARNGRLPDGDCAMTRNELSPSVSRQESYISSSRNEIPLRFINGWMTATERIQCERYFPWIFPFISSWHEPFKMIASFHLNSLSFRCETSADGLRISSVQRIESRAIRFLK